MYWIFLIVLVLIPWYFFFYKPKQYFKNYGIPYFQSAPIFGEMLPVALRRNSMFDNIQRIYNKMGNSRFHGIFIFVTPCIFIKDPQLIKDIAIKHFENFTDHTVLLSNEVDTILGNGLLALRGFEWKNIRTILTPAFGSKIRPMFMLMKKCSDEFINHLKNECKGQETTVLDMKETFTVITNNVISSCAFGLELDSFKEPNNEFYKISKDITNVSGKRGLTLFMASLSLTFMKIVNWSYLSTHESNFFRKLFGDALKYREDNNIVRPDMIDLLLQAKNGQLKEDESQDVDERISGVKKNQKLDVDNDVIVAQAVTFLAGGFATVSNLMCFTAYELALDQDVQDKLIKEIDNVLVEYDGKVTYEAIMQMKYLDMVVSESNRLHTAVPLTDRVCTKDFHLEDDNGKQILIKKGVQIHIPISALARDPKYFPNPNKFDPERFSDKNKDSIISGTYIPFGLGPRTCIGKRFALLEVKTILATVLTNFKIVTVEKTQIPIRICKSSITTIPESEVYLGLQKRY